MIEFKKGSLWLKFRIENANYCILSDYIESIAIPRAIDPVPENHPAIMGVTTHGGEVLRVIDMRIVFGKASMEQCVKEFSLMREMHISWVEELRRYIYEGGEFTKAVDPNLCKFGVWYNSFHTDNSRLNRILKTIRNPHEKIHHCGAEIVALKSQDGDNQTQIDEIFDEVERLCHEDIVPLLNRMIDTYRAANKGVLLVVNIGEDHACLLVDEVKFPIPCSRAKQEAFANNIIRSRYLRDLVIDDGNIMLEINVEEILEI